MYDPRTSRIRGLARPEEFENLREPRAQNPYHTRKSDRPGHAGCRGRLSRHGQIRPKVLAVGLEQSLHEEAELDRKVVEKIVMENLELTALRQRFIDLPLFQRIPETPDGNFEELLLHVLDYADEQQAEAERVDELYTTTLEQARELKDLLKRQVDFLKTKSNKADRLALATAIETNLMNYKEI